ncbi:hypothetical protein NVP1113A_09 [Vibrio phage 1.113.A._10N.286.51.E7]|nr:hypothetical protein NVP1113A_09 [Vibrio phage 1.113.A._10N.286.51.E7]
MFTCGECGASDLSSIDVRTTEGKLCYHSIVCEDCYDELESDDEE